MTWRFSRGAPPATPPRRRASARQRGAALLLAVSSIAILTALGVQLAYDTRVSLQMAVNARDELRAEYLARSAVSLSRLVLHFQQQLDQAGGGLPPQLTQLLQQATASGAQLPPQLAALTAGQGGQGGQAGQAGGGTTIRLWELVPIDSGIAALFLSGDARRAERSAGAPQRPPPAAGPAAPGAPPAPGAAPLPRAFADMEGAFHASIEDEERKINVRQFDSLGYFPAAQAARLYDLIKDPRWDFLFDRDDANGLRVSRTDLFTFVKDWIDVDETGSSFSNDPTKPFVQGYGDENAYYDRLPDRYKAKNAPFDSLDELYLLPGVSDAFMAAFGDKLTVYPDVQAAINVNTDDPQQILLNALLMSDPPGVPQPALADPSFMKNLQQALALVRPLPFMSITPQQFASVLQSLGVKLSPLYLQASNTDTRSPFGNKSSTFHIRAEGSAGQVHKTIDLVVTFDRRAEAQALDQGRILHWHEE